MLAFGALIIAHKNLIELVSMSAGGNIVLCISVLKFPIVCKECLPRSVNELRSVLFSNVFIFLVTCVE